MKITVKMLEKAKACKHQLDIFKKQWPKGAIVTLKNCEKAMVLGLDLDWVAMVFFTIAAYTKYNEAMNVAMTEHYKTSRLAYAKYNTATDLARTKISKIVTTSKIAYNKAQCVAFFTASKLKK